MPEPVVEEAGHGRLETPKPLATFLAQDDAAVLLGDASPGSHPRVAVRLRDVGELRALTVPTGVVAPTIGVFLDEGSGALTLTPPGDGPPLTQLRSRAAAGGWWTVLRFAAPVDVGAVLARLAAQAVWGASVLPAPALDVRVLNPCGFLVEAPDPVVDAVALPPVVTAGVVAGLRSARGVHVDRWRDDLLGLALAGVPVVADDTGPAPAALAAALTAPVDLDDALAREEHSIVLRRAALDLVLPDPPSVSVLLATRRAEMLDFALAQVARQRAVRLELVLAPHGFAVDEARVRAAVPGVEVVVLPHPAETLFGDVLHAAAQAASGDVLLKMDDDDWYSVDAVADLLRARAYSGAELVGMPAELHYLTEPDLTVRRGHAVELYARFVAGGTMLLDRDALRAAGGFRSVRKYVDAQLIDGLLAAGGAVYRTHGLGYVLRRNPTGHTWQVDLDYLLDPVRTVATWPGFRPSRLLDGP